MAGSWEQGDEIPGFVKSGIFFSHILKKVSNPCS